MKQEILADLLVLSIYSLIHIKFYYNHIKFYYNKDQYIPVTLEDFLRPSTFLKE